MVGRYRLYVDESGDGSIKDVEDPRYRYLGVTGVIVELERHNRDLTRELDALKRTHFPVHTPERPVILVRTELIRKTGAFHVLADPARCAAWEAAVLDLLRRWATAPITVVVDKLGTQRKYGDKDEDPYLRAMRFMVERYRAWLYYRSGVGDVLCESRGKAEDRRLRAAYRLLYEHGTGWQTAEELQEALTSGELKLDRKDRNVAALQVADLLANPARLSLLQDFRGEPLRPGTFTQRVIEEVKPNYHRSNRVIFPK